MSTTNKQAWFAVLMAWVLLGGFLVLLAFVGHKAINEPVAAEPVYGVAGARTVGNNTYIPLGDHVDSGRELILNTLSRFEGQHPELRVLSFEPEMYHSEVYTHITGVWVHHEPRK